MATISFTPIVPQSQRRADGSYNVKIRVTFKRVSRWVATSVSVMKGQLTRAGKIKDPAVLASMDALIGDLRKEISELSPFALEQMDVDDVLAYIRKKKQTASFKLDFFAWTERYIQTLTPSMAAETRSAINGFARYLGKREIDINEITAAMLRDFVDFLNQEPRMAAVRSQGTVKASKVPKVKDAQARNYLNKLKRCYEGAKRKYNDEDNGIIVIPRDPFSRVTVKPAVHQGQKNLGIEGIQKILDARPSDARQRWALDLFVLSFGTMGANVADLYNAAPPVGGWWTYRRQKTTRRRRDKAEMQVAIQPQLAAVLARLEDRPGSGRWLSLHREFARATYVSRAANAALKVWAEKEGMEPFTMYAARHSWASIARSAAVGVDKATVDDCLNHVGDRAIADIYIDKDREVFADANRRVLAAFRWDGPGGPEADDLGRG